MASRAKQRLLERLQGEQVLSERPQRDHVLPEFAKLAFSQHGEDLITPELLWRYGRDVKEGFYVDIGAYHPWNASNTAALYLHGWSGIAVDPNDYMAAIYRSERPRDIFVEAAVAGHEGTGTYHSFGAAASSNTLDSEWAESVVRTQNIDVEEARTVKTLTLSSLLNDHLPEDTPIDLLNVDVEGLDYTVLESNDWERYRPFLIAVEEYQMDLSDLASSSIHELLIPLGYRLVSRAVLTNFYVLG